MKNTSSQSNLYGSLKVYTEEETDTTKVCYIIPRWYFGELKEVFNLAWSMAATAFFFMLMAPISLIFAGQLGVLFLDGVGLANTILNISGIMVGAGLSTACDTLFSQAYGSANKKRVGVYLQRALMCILVCTLPCWAIHLNCESLLIALGQDDRIARIAGRYVLLFMPAIPAHFSYAILNKYLRNQNIVRPTMFIGVTGLGVNALCQYIFVSVLEYGIEGSAISQVLGFYTLFLGTIGYILISKVYRETWGGLTVEAFQEWGYFYKLAIAGLLMVCLQFWAFELGTLLSGLLGEVQLGAQAMMFQMEGITYTIPIGVAIGCNIRIGQLLGANKSKQARRSMLTGFTLAWYCCIVIIILLVSLKDYIPQIFSSDREVIELTSTLLPILALYNILDGTAAVSTGILRGCGRQNVAALIIFVGMYCLGLPIGISMMFLTNLETAGFWWGMTVAMVVEGTTYFITAYRTNWDFQSKMAQVRSGVLKGKGPRGNTTIKKEDESISVGITENELSQGDRTALLSHEDKANPLQKRQYCGEYTTSQVDMRLVNAIPEVLTNSQLLFRRSVFILAMVSVLAMGIFLRFFLSFPVDMSALCLPSIPANGTMINGTIILQNISYPLCSNETELLR